MLRSKSIREGTLGLFILLGLLVFGGIIFWLRGGRINDTSYQITVVFDNAGGLREGAKVRYRGIDVGRIVEIIPGSNGVDIVMEIENSLRIPNEVMIQTNSYGLLGETIIDMSPQEQLTAEAKSVDPLSEQCPELQLILCDQERIKGKTGSELIESLTTLSELYSSEEFYGNLNAAAKNAALAGERIAALSDDLSDFSQEIKKDVDRFTKTADAFTNTANVSTEQITRLANEFSTTSQQISLLVSNINSVIDNNKYNLGEAITNVTDTSKELSSLVKQLEFTAAEVNTNLEDIDLKQIVTNLEDLTENLQQFSTELNKPTNIVSLQETLDSARVTFSNTAKITSDLDDLTGDPEFRNNVRKLVDGLSNLLSYSDTIEKQIELVQILEEVNTIITDKNIDNSQPIPSLNLKKLDKKTKN